MEKIQNKKNLINYFRLNMQTTTNGEKIYGISDIKCNCYSTMGCEKCRREVNKLNRLYARINNLKN